LDRERCVLCARCTRFSNQIAGDPMIELLYANMGQPSKCHRAVKMAEDTFADCAKGDGDPDWIRFFSEAELNAENAHSYRDLAYVAGRSPTYAKMADPVMRQAVKLFGEEAESDAGPQRSYALNLIGMATVHLLQKEPEQAAGVARLALPLAKRVRSERVNNRLRKTVDTAVRQFGDVPQIADLGERLATLMPDTPGAAGPGQAV
ncbi:hypothetical protein ABZ554_38110, partial [Streptomyces sp. NPDC020125]